MTPALYFDLGSPYAFLAVERAERVLGVMPSLRPIFLGGIFVMRGRGSWAYTTERETNIAEVERRAALYGLAPLKWPPGWPNRTLDAMRAAIWAEMNEALPSFARLAFRRAFLEGADLSDVDVLIDIGRAVGLDDVVLRRAIERPAIKERLRAATDAAWKRGVRGAPTLIIGHSIYYGDDQLEQAAARAAA